MELLKRLTRSLFASFLSPKKKRRTKVSRKQTVRKVKKTRPKPKLKKRKPSGPSRKRPKAKQAIRRTAVKKPKRAKPSSAPPPLGTLVGEVTHYFNHIRVAVVKIHSGELRLMDPIRFKGHTTDFKQTIGSMQINHKTVDRVGPGDDFGLQVKKRVRGGDQVFRLTS